jgi:hypothetical protein
MGWLLGSKGIWIEISITVIVRKERKIEGKVGESWRRRREQ